MGRNIVRKRIELDIDDVAWYNRQYPVGSLSATLAMLLHEFRKANTLTPAEYAKIAVTTLNEELKGS